MSGCSMIVSNSNSRINRGRFATTTRIGCVMIVAPSSDRFGRGAHYSRVGEKREGSKRVLNGSVRKSQLNTTQVLRLNPDKSTAGTVLVLSIFCPGRERRIEIN